jgi:hypothetical protein
MKNLLLMTVLFLPDLSLTRAADVSADVTGSTNAIATVVMAQRADAIQRGAPASDVVDRMMADTIKSLTGASDEASAWRSLVATNDVVGIKISTQGAPLHATHRVVVDAIARGLHKAGLSPDQIVVWDLDARKMKAAGFDPAVDPTPKLYRIEAVMPDRWDADAFYTSVLVGKLIWGDLLFGRDDQQLHTRSHLPLVVTKTVTKLINVPVWQDHDPCGFRGGLYSLSIGALDNTRRFEGFGQTGNPAIAEIVNLPVMRGKLVLTVADALVVGYAGGGAFKPRYSWTHGALYGSRDPVALDAVGLKLVEEKRAEAKLPPVSPMAGHIQTAAKLRLGVADLEKIEVRPATR